MTVRADVFFKSDAFRLLFTLAFQRALPPCPIKPPTNYDAEVTPLHIQHASLKINFSTLFSGLVCRRVGPVSATYLEAAAAKHLSAIFASFASPHPPSSHLSAVAKDAPFPVLAATALQNALSHPTAPPPARWKAGQLKNPGSRTLQKPLHPYWSGLLERLRWGMLQLIWEEKREWFAWSIAPNDFVGEEELRRQLERGIVKSQKLVLRELRRQWAEMHGQWAARVAGSD
jgi:hypothetical protein